MPISAKCRVMTDNDDNQTQAQIQALGDYLQQQRQDAGLTVAEFAQKTRISPAALRAMESGDYQALPAYAFSRGFYTLYAKGLGLNCEQIVKWYDDERRQAGNIIDASINRSATYGTPEIHRMASAAGPARPLVTLLILLAILALVAVTFCWSFGINPVTVIREKTHLVQTRSLYYQRYFRISNTGKVIRRTEEKKKAPLVTLNGEI